MSVLVVLIAVSLIVAVGFLIAFLWAVKSGQFNDTYTPSVSMLFNNDNKKENNTDSKINNSDRKE